MEQSVALQKTLSGLALLTVFLLPSTTYLRGTQIFPWAVVIGGGCALILWLTVGETLLQGRARLHQERERVKGMHH